LPVVLINLKGILKSVYVSKNVAVNGDLFFKLEKKFVNTFEKNSLEVNGF